MDRSNRRNPRLRAQTGMKAATIDRSIAAAFQPPSPPTSRFEGMNVTPSLPAILPSGKSASEKMTESELVGVATRRGLTFPEMLWLISGLRKTGAALTASEFEEIASEMSSHEAQVAQVQIWLDDHGPFETLSDAVSAFNEDGDRSSSDGIKTFAFAFVPAADRYVPYHPSGQAQPQGQAPAQQPAQQQAPAGPTAEEVIGTAINRGADAANNLIREANTTRRAEIEAEARVALAEIAARNGGAIPQSGQDAQTAAMLQLLMQQIAQQRQQPAGPSTARVALIVGGALGVAALIAAGAYFATRK